MQLQNFLSWNKAKIKHSCKSQLYNMSLLSVDLVRHFDVPAHSRPKNLSLIFDLFIILKDKYIDQVKTMVIKCST